jgi:hypothetical protein
VNTAILSEGAQEEEDSRQENETDDSDKVQSSNSQVSIFTLFTDLQGVDMVAISHDSDHGGLVRDILAANKTLEQVLVN